MSPQKYLVSRARIGIIIANYHPGKTRQLVRNGPTTYKNVDISCISATVNRSRSSSVFPRRAVCLRARRQDEMTRRSRVSAAILCWTAILVTGAGYLHLDAQAPRPQAATVTPRPQVMAAQA